MAKKKLIGEFNEMIKITSTQWKFFVLNGLSIPMDLHIKKYRLDGPEYHPSEYAGFVPFKHDKGNFAPYVPPKGQEFLLGYLCSKWNKEIIDKMAGTI